MKDEFLKEFGERAMARRQELGLSQLEVAKKIGFKTKQAYSMIECGDRGLSQSKCVALAKALDTTVSYLMGVDDENVPFGEDLDKYNEQVDLLPRDRTEELIIRIYRTLSPEDKETVTKLIERLAPPEQSQPSEHI